MKTQSFIVTNKEEELDILQTIERERPDVRWQGEDKPTKWIPSTRNIRFSYSIDIYDKIIGWSYVSDTASYPNWQIGQSLPPPQKTALEQLIEIPENEDGSITITKELQAQIVMELKGVENE